jgi:hypothetical protein
MQKGRQEKTDETDPILDWDLKRKEAEGLENGKVVVEMSVVF